MADLCGVFGDTLCETGKSIRDAISFGTDPLGYMAQKLQSAANEMATSLLPALQKATEPNLTKDWFVSAYKVSFALGIMVWIVFLGWNFVQLARRRISSDALVESLTFYTPAFFLGVLFGPALGTFMLKFTGELSKGLIKWGVGTTYDGTKKQLVAAIEAGSPEQIAGGAIVAIIVFTGLILALCTVFIVLLVMQITLYLAGAVFPLSLAWLAHPTQRSRGLKVAMVWLGLNCAHVLIFLLLGIAFMMIGGLGNTYDGKLQVAANLFVAIIALFLAVGTPFGLLAFAPVGPSSAGVRDPFPASGGGGQVGGGYPQSSGDSQTAQMSRGGSSEAEYDDDYSGSGGGGSSSQPVLAGVGGGAGAGSAASMEAADGESGADGAGGSGGADAGGAESAGGASAGSGGAGSASGGAGGGAGGTAGGAASGAGSAGAGAAGGAAAAASGGTAGVVAAAAAQNDSTEQGGGGGDAATGIGLAVGLGAISAGVGTAAVVAVGAASTAAEMIQGSGELAMDQMDHAEGPGRMQTRTLGGEGGRRGFFGGSHSRTRITGLIVVAVVGALATISFQATGLFLSVLAAGVVFLVTIRTHRGSLLSRVQARRRWRERNKLGTVDFRPVAQRPVELEHAGRSRKERAAARRAWAGFRDWPDGAEGMYWLQRGRGEPGIAWHAPTGEDAYLSVAFSVDGQVRGIEGDLFMESAMVAWGTLLARYGSPSQLPARVQSLTRVVPVDSAYHEAWVVDHLADDALEELKASYAEVVQRVSRSGLMQRHFVVVRWPITGAFLAAAARRGPAQAGWRELMKAEIRAVTSHLRTAKLGRVAPLSAAQLAAVLRHMQTPSWPIDQAGDVDVAAPWVASHDELSATITTGPGPDGHTDEWWHRTALIPIDSVETGPRTSMWLTPLLSRMPHPIVRTLSLQTEVIPARDARQGARTDVTTDLADLEAQRQKGTLTSEELAVALTAARSRLDDLRPGSGHHGAGWVGHLTISARSRDALIDATAKITEAASNAGIAALEWQDTQQSAASASTWPIARGMRPVQRNASTRLRGALAGSGSKEAI